MNTHNIDRNNSKPASIIRAVNVINNYGIPVSSARYLLHNEWRVKAAQEHIFSSYYLLRWEASYFRSILQEGTVTREGKTYQVIYYRTTPAEISKHSGDLLLSFRELIPDYECYPTVLVTLIKE